jgi:quinol-cytochrome oxidoreductase complex cytochrome b subunit
MNYKDELKVVNKLKDERTVSDHSYAPMIVKTIVFTFIGLICIAFVALLTHLAFENTPSPATATVTK